MLVSAWYNTIIPLPLDTGRVLGIAGGKVITLNAKKQIRLSIPGEEERVLMTLKEELLSRYWFVQDKYLVLEETDSFGNQPVLSILSLE